MKKQKIIFLSLAFILLTTGNILSKRLTGQEYPLAVPGTRLNFKAVEATLPESVIQNFVLSAGNTEMKNGRPYQWLLLKGNKKNGGHFSLWLLTSVYPPVTKEMAEKVIARYILVKSGSEPVEYIDKMPGSALLPNTGAWKYLLPQSPDRGNPFTGKVKKVKLLGHEYTLYKKEQTSLSALPASTRKLELTPDVLIGIPHNSRMKYSNRKYDDSEYEYVSLTKENYREMITAGMNCFYVSRREQPWLENEPVFYWGTGGADVLYPECLYQSNYWGPVIFFDEPMVGTRDRVLRPKLRGNPEYRKTITPDNAFNEFKKVFHKKKYEEGPKRLIEELNARKDVDTGDMDFLQQNIFSWETMVSSAAYQLSEGNNSPPNAMVFEPPGRFGTRRVLPELNMCFDCQIPATDPENLTGIIYGFLRGGARATQKNWGMSIYGQVDRSDAWWFMTRAYDLGATLFFFWDNHRLAAVPYREYLMLSENLRKHAISHPQRNLAKLRTSAEVAILIPSYYNLGHVKMGLGLITGLPELNLERKNSHGIKYRTIMNNFLIEVERCIRLGVEYDLLWNLNNLNLSGYREIITIKEDGKVEVKQRDRTRLLDGPRIPERPGGKPPALSVEVKISGNGHPAAITALARVTKGSAPVYYTLGADSNGIYRNQYVLWELFGPEDEDYTDLWNDRWAASITEQDDGAKVEIRFEIDKPGAYRLRAATTDLAGRSTVIWKEIHIPQ